MNAIARFRKFLYRALILFSLSGLGRGLLSGCSSLSFFLQMVNL